MCMDGAVTNFSLGILFVFCVLLPIIIFPKNRRSTERYHIFSKSFGMELPLTGLSSEDKMR